MPSRSDLVPLSFTPTNSEGFSLTFASQQVCA